MVSAGTPRVQSVQTLVRLIYEDGCVAAVTTEPVETQLDPMEPSRRPSVETLTQLAASQGDAAIRVVQERGPDRIYAMAKANPKPATCIRPNPSSSLPPSQEPPQ